MPIELKSRSGRSRTQASLIRSATSFTLGGSLALNYLPAREEAMNRQVIVSGGGTGMGLAIAGRFARAGDDVVTLGRRESVLADAAASLNEEVGRSAVRFFPVDLTDPAAVGELTDRLPPVVDVLVNNAGGVRGGADETLQQVAEAFFENLATNFVSAVLLTTLVRPKLRDGSRVISLGSIAGLRAGGGAYGAAKAALIGWTYSLAAELGPEGVTANVVAPGYVTETEFFGETMTVERHGRLVAETMTGRPSTPADVAAAVFYLASPEAAQVTGQVLQVNGGALVGRG
jgi:NAD(P)-dependent dehydrogenase (short-subunit alcohol dehydrogenase family)